MEERIIIDHVRILIADDYEVVRRGVIAILAARPKWTVIAEAANGREATEKARKLKPNVVILDIGMPELNGLDAMRQILKDVPLAKVLIFTEDESEETARDALEIGALGYLFKSDSGNELVAAVESILQDKPYMTPRVSRMMLEIYRKLHAASPERASYSRLTSREREILQSVAEGRSTKEIAATLNVSAKTVETHRANIIRKLQLSSLPDLVRYAIRNRIIAP